MERVFVTSSGRKRRRRGFTLVLFAMLLFGLFALAALVIDIGMARVAQRQMQTAADSAALEGLRFRDELPPGFSAPADLEQSRRQQASDIVAWTFDDNLNPNDGDLVNFGAGPRIDLGPGIDEGGTMNAGQFISSPENPNPNPKVGSLPNPPVYKPTRSDATTRGLELNVANAIHGDMLAGNYIAVNPTNPNDRDWHVEQTDYSRTDFVSTAARPDAFLVRMRRLHDDLDTVDTEAGVSSKGPEIPYLFGRGAMINRDPDVEYSPRHHGMTVRATSISQARHALSVGASSPSHSLPGSIALAVYLNFWQGLADGSVTTLEIDASGEVRNSSMAIGGYVIVADGSSQAYSLGASLSQIPTPDVNGYRDAVFNNAAEVGTSRQVFVPIVGSSGTLTSGRIVGFGFAILNTGTNANELSLTKRDSHIAHQNASAVLTGVLESSVANDIISANRNLGNSSLLAPALVK